jgi:hypothetical protein
MKPIEERAREAGVPVDWLRDRPRKRRVLWRDVPRRFLVIQARCAVIGILDLDGFAEWVLPDGARDPSVSNPGSLSSALRTALASKQITADPQLRRAMRALYRWEFRQCARVGYACDPPGPSGAPRPLPAEDDLRAHMREAIRWLEYVVGLGAEPSSAAARDLARLRAAWG